MSPIRQIILGAVIGVVFGLPFGIFISYPPTIQKQLAGYEIETVREVMIRYEINRHR